MNEVVVDNETYYQPPQSPIPLPPLPEGGGCRAERKYAFLERGWENGKKFFIDQWEDEQRGENLRNFPWSEPGHELTLR